MIPFRDNVRCRTTPVITVGLIILNSLLFFYELSLGPEIQDFLSAYGVVPSNVIEWPSSGQTFGNLLTPYVTSMFLHGGWLHLIGNMWYLWIFGDNVEDRFGHLRFLLFYIVAGLGAGIVHTAVNYDSAVPTIGASGAVAGVLGAYVVLYPFARVLTLVPLIFIWQIIEVPALIVLGLWFFIQFFSGTSSLATTSPAGGGVAWWAHVGGFVLGMTFVLIRRRHETPQSF